MTAPTSPGTTRMTRDHVIPKMNGGRKTVPCCWACNQIKGDMSPAMWAKFRDHQAEWWNMLSTTNLRGIRLYVAVLG